MITLTEGKKNCPPKDLDPKNNICIVQELADGSKHWGNEAPIEACNTKTGPHNKFGGDFNEN